ncbi:LacI family DNA-binding transcriptional regulator, partial [Alkalibacterium gilvum]|uniref:LacI family DNA-binding transcriptional regulator n=1 Tax=Alkalibacterium gilvum TaxID=1130080 RepID=UPI003F91BFE6
MATIKEVAKYAGVSVATVSRALNKNGYVSEEAQKKVENAIKALEYYPNEVARSLYQKKSKMIGLLLPDISNPYFPLLMKGIEENARENGYSVILGNVEEGSELGQDYMTLFGQQNV